MAREKFLKTEDLLAWLDELGKERKIYVPVREGGTVVFRPHKSGVEPALVKDATVSPKGILFPQSHELFGFEQSKDPENPEHMALKVVARTEAEPALVFGARPCGVRGFNIFDRVYNGTKFPDPYYRSARDNTVFVTIACAQTENTCFCNWVGSGPDDPSGSDVLATPVQGGYVLEPVTERGEALLKGSLLGNAGKKIKEAEKVKASARESLGEPPDLSTVSESLMALFDDQEFWREVAAKCLSCGACTYLCPTCYCFTITDEARGLTGKRLRSWDHCMSYLYSLEASGHNPRPTKAHRLKNRVSHKFSYYPKLHDGILACCGCGRCIRSCPVSMDIRETVLKAIDRAKIKNCEVKHG